MSIGNNVVIQGIYNDIEESLNTILDAHAAELGGLLRLQQEQVKIVADQKKMVLSEMEETKKKKNVQKRLDSLDKEFIQEKEKLDKELSKLKEFIMDSIKQENCNGNNKVDRDLVDYVISIKNAVKQKNNEAMIVLNNQADEEYKLFSTIISGFSDEFYKRLDRLTNFWQKKISAVNDFLKAKGMIDKEYGIDEFVFETTDSIKHSETIKSNATTATNVTGKLLDKALRPGVGCIAMAGIKQLQIGLKHISDRITGHRLYKSIFSGIDSDYDITEVSPSEIDRRDKMYKNAIPPGHIHTGDESDYESDSSIDTNYVQSLPGSQQGPEVNVLDNTPPSGITRSLSLPLEGNVNSFNTRFSTRSDDYRLSRRRVPGNMLPDNFNLFGEYKPISRSRSRSRSLSRSRSRSLSRSRSRNRSPGSRSRRFQKKSPTSANSMGGKKHRRRTTHRKKRIN